MISLESFKPHHVEKIHVKVPLSIDSSRFLVKTVDLKSEFDEVVRLRYEVFFEEGLDQKNPTAVDIDDFDGICDHLIVQEKTSQAIVGTYRLNSSLFSSRFYSQQEFHMDAFLALPGIKLELGRACIKKEFRNGITIALLWKGIAEYISKTKARWLFGCGSVNTTSPLQIQRIQNFLRKEGHVFEDVPISVTDPFSIWPEANFEDLSGGESEGLPSLMKAYLKAGSRLVEEPAFDKDFQCFDFLTILNTEKMRGAYERRYG